MIEIVETRAFASDGLAIVEETGGVWRTFNRPWWDFSAWVWWWLAPGRKKTIITRHSSGKRHRVRAFQVAPKHIRVDSLQKAS